MTLQDKVRALAYAVAVVGGTAGGYSPNEVLANRANLLQMLYDAEVDATREHHATTNT